MDHAQKRHEEYQYLDLVSSLINAKNNEGVQDFGINRTGTKALFGIGHLMRYNNKSVN